MKKGDNCVSGASWMLTKFLGAFMLLMGLKMLMDYQGMVGIMMGVGGNVDLGAVTPLGDLIAQLIAYTWPVVSTLIGISLLTSYRSCLAKMVFVVYLLFFALAHDRSKK